jgi:hypothetical protein
MSAREIFSHIDLDGDGTITKSEFHKALTGRRKNEIRSLFDAKGLSWQDVFAKIDSDKNQGISFAEFNRAFPARKAAAQSFSYDALAAGDGTYTRAEANLPKGHKQLAAERGVRPGSAAAALSAPPARAPAPAPARATPRPATKTSAGKPAPARAAPARPAPTRKGLAGTAPVSKRYTADPAGVRGGSALEAVTCRTASGNRHATNTAGPAGQGFRAGKKVHAAEVRADHEREQAELERSAVVARAKAKRAYKRGGAGAY